MSSSTFEKFETNCSCLINVRESIISPREKRFLGMTCSKPQSCLAFGEDMLKTTRLLSIWLSFSSFRDGSNDYQRFLRSCLSNITCLNLQAGVPWSVSESLCNYYAKLIIKTTFSLQWLQLQCLTCLFWSMRKLGNNGGQVFSNLSFLKL